MLPPDYRWEPLWEGQGLYLHGVKDFRCRCAWWEPLPGGGGVLLHWGVRDCLPNQRTLATPAGATRFAEAWATKWDAEIRRHVAEKGKGYSLAPPSPEVAQAAASRDLFRRRGHRKEWWRKKQPNQA